jgi:hypothetical protein
LKDSCKDIDYLFQNTNFFKSKYQKMMYLFQYLNEVEKERKKIFYIDEDNINLIISYCTYAASMIRSDNNNSIISTINTKKSTKKINKK